MTKEQAAEQEYPNPDDSMRGVELQQAFIDGWEACEANRWIRVEDELPKDDNNVFAICDGKLMVMSYVSFKNDGAIFREWCNCHGDIFGDAFYDDNYKVTHWQPIPQPPVK